MTAKYHNYKIYCSIALLLMLFLSLLLFLNFTKNQKHWFKGNLHCHTNRSIGDSSFEEVLEWYANHDYDFIAISDYDNHSKGMRWRRGDGKQILVLSGEEVSIDEYHIGVVNTPEQILPARATEQRQEAIKKNIATFYTTQGKLKSNEQASGIAALLLKKESIDNFRQKVESANGIAVFNHPSLSGDETAFINFSDKFSFFELMGAGNVYFYPKATSQPFDVEKTWDKILTQGKKLYGVGVDDAHYFKNQTAQKPGFAWIYVYASTLSPDAIMQAMKRGDFYVSTGIRFATIVLSHKKIEVKIDSKKALTYEIQFLGAGGKVLAETRNSFAQYIPRGDEQYIRVRAHNSLSEKAFSQPIFLDAGQ